MTWFKIDDGFFMNMKVVEAGNAAVGLWVRAGAWCSQQLTDGYVPEAVARTFGTATEVDSLVDSGLWECVEGGYQFPDWLEYNPSADEVKATRAASAERQRQSRTRRSDDAEDVTRESRVSHSDVTAKSRVTAREVTRESQHPDPTRPDPINPPPPGEVIHRVVVVAAKRIIEVAPPTTAPKNASAYQAAMCRRLKIEYDVGALIAIHGADHAADVIVQTETGPPARPAAPAGPEHDPSCPDCAGSGWRTVDFDNATVDRCTCTSDIAPVLKLRRAT
jgi:hypothetical protein